MAETEGEEGGAADIRQVRTFSKELDTFQLYVVLSASSELSHQLAKAWTLIHGRDCINVNLAFHNSAFLFSQLLEETTKKLDWHPSPPRGRFQANLHDSDDEMSHEQNRVSS